MNLIQDIEKNELSHGSIPFWSWNDKLEPEELRRQIRKMKDLGMRGFFMHARGGLETAYLSDDWYECINACVDEAEKLGMEAWSYDENGWPSGFAGGKLLEDPKNFASFLTYKKYDTFPAEDHILGVYVIENNVGRRVDGPAAGVDAYYAVFQNWDSSYVDTMDASITAKFIEAKHADYKKHIDADKFGTVMPGFFTDEPQYFRYGTPWSDTFLTTFPAAYGYDPKDNLIAMFLPVQGYESYRYDYYRLCHRSFIFNFIKPIYDWCDANGCKVTGHAVEELDLHGEMFGCGGIMPFYMFEHIPGVDFLTRGRVGDAGFRQLGSAVAQLGKKEALSEMFACCGWDVSPVELKRIAEHQYVNGINLMCQHLYPYSIRGQRKRDYPCHYSEHLPWQDDMKEFNTYFNRLGYTLSLGKEDVHVLVIHPIHSAWLTYQRAAEWRSVETLNNDFQALTDLLSTRQIPFHFGDETMMETLASVDSDRIRVGECTYDTVIIPAMDNLDSTTVALLQDYCKAGGKVWLYGKKPCRQSGKPTSFDWLASNVTLEDISASIPVHFWGKDANEMRVMVRNTAYGRLIYAVSLAEKQISDITMSVDHCRGLAALNLTTMAYEPVNGRALPDGHFEVYLRPDAVSSFVFVESEAVPAASRPAPIGPALRFDGPFTFAELPVNQLTLDRFKVSRDGGKTYSEELPYECIKDTLLKDRFEGELAMQTSFTLETLPQDLKLVMEPCKYTSIMVNGTAIQLSDEWYLDRSFRTADIAALVKPGKNEITYTLHYFQRDYVYYVLYGGVSESLRNCLCFDTELECLYLIGHFCVQSETPFWKEGAYARTTKGPFKLTAQKNEADVRDLVADGYPFFAGRLTLKNTVTYTPGDPTVLYLKGRCPVCHVCVNGKPAPSTLFVNHVDLKDLLVPGKNEITLTLVNSNRNLLGPLHGIEPENLGVGPHSFSVEKCWNGNECKQFNPRYAFVRLGYDL